MISAKELAKIFSSRVVVMGQDGHSTMYRIELPATFRQGKSAFCLVVPKVGDDGRIVRLFKADRYCTSFVDVDGNEQTASHRLANEIRVRAVTFMSAYSSTGKASPYLIQGAIDKFVNQLPDVEVNEHADYAARSRVAFDVPEMPGPFEHLDFLSELLKKWWGEVDLVDTPATGKIGTVGFRCIQGSIFGPSTSKIPFGNLLAVKRMCIMGRIFRNAMHVDGQSPPLVRVSPDIPDAPSVNALCISMVLPDNYEDAVVMSQSFAEKLHGTRDVVFHLVEPKQLYVSIGDVVGDGSPLGKVVTGTEVASMNKFESGIVGAISQEDRVVAGEIKDVTRITVVAQHPFMTGDKISTRAAMKGVAVVVPDDEMPVYMGGPVDVVFNPLCMTRRACMSQLAEGWLGLDCIENDTSVVVDPWDKRGIRQIAEETGVDRDGRDVVQYNGSSHRVFVSYLAILRMNKVVTGMGSFCGPEVPYDLHGFEDRSSGAVKISPPELIAMAAVGARGLIGEVLDHARGKDAFYHLLKASLGHEGKVIMRDAVSVGQVMVEL